MAVVMAVAVPVWVAVTMAAVVAAAVVTPAVVGSSGSVGNQLGLGGIVASAAAAVQQ